MFLESQTPGWGQPVGAPDGPPMSPTGGSPGEQRRRGILFQEVTAEAAAAVVFAVAAVAAAALAATGRRHLESQEKARGQGLGLQRAWAPSRPPLSQRDAAAVAAAATAAAAVAVAAAAWGRGEAAAAAETLSALHEAPHEKVPCSL